MAEPVTAGGVVGALAAPFTKLIETVSAGLGRVYEPTYQRRMARAEADQMVILARAAIEVTDIQRRAADRWLAVEVTRQQNIEAIAEKARGELPPTVNDIPVDQGWTARFFDMCKDVSQEDIQSLWARVLAGEVSKPGSYSLRTLQVLAMLSPQEAQVFHVFCSFMFAATGPFAFLERESFMRSRGVGFAQRQMLVQAGLVQVETNGVHMPDHVGPLYLFPLDQGPMLVGLAIDPLRPTKYDLGNVILTQAGVELSRLWRGTIDQDHVAWLIEKFRSKGWQMAQMSFDRGAEGEPLPGSDFPAFVLEFFEKGGLSPVSDSTGVEG